MSAKWERAHEAIHYQTDQLESMLDSLYDLLQFQIERDGTDHELAIFHLRKMAGYKGRLTTIRNQSNALADAANPSAANELPF